MPRNLERNKRTAMAFYEEAFNGAPREAAAKHVGERYLQHNPAVADGVEGFAEYFERMAREYPEKRVEFLRAVAEGDLVALHTRQAWAGEGDYVTMDFFRFDERGKIVEHWDSIQRVPEESANDNTMF
jgi:predicted SnoaL-like aldol condensation-catalyzing enzyme